MLDPNWRARAESAAEVVARVRNGARCFVHGAAMTPTPLLDALCAIEHLSGVRLYHLHTDGPAPWATPPASERVRGVFVRPTSRSTARPRCAPRPARWDPPDAPDSRIVADEAGAVRRDQEHRDGALDRHWERDARLQQALDSAPTVGRQHHQFTRATTS